MIIFISNRNTITTRFVFTTLRVYNQNIVRTRLPVKHRGMPLDIYIYFFIDFEHRNNKEMHNFYYIIIILMFRRANIQNFLWFDRVMTECSLFSVSPEIIYFFSASNRTSLLLALL